MPTKICMIQISPELHAKIKDAANKYQLTMQSTAASILAYGLERLPSVFPVKMVPLGSVPEPTFNMIQKVAADQKRAPSEVIDEVLRRGLKIYATT